MKNYLSKWNFMRIIRLVLGIVIIVQGIQAQQWMLVALGGLFTLMPLFNIGCCGTAGCSINYSSRKNTKTEDITYEEVK
ncbi:hypothetical protein [Pseudopedobacter beijingensis]|uniref:DUF2892 domain-containing protein n=1 Tax=Pseudopedobacter beijingensis TaxID=1207056 RepID=A0ABW4ICV5_9SPHI